MEEQLKILIEDYERKIHNCNVTLKLDIDEITKARVITKRGCYRSFLTELKRTLK